MIEIFGGSPILYDPIVEYMEILFSQEDLSWVCNYGEMNQEWGESSKRDGSLCFLNWEINFPDFVEEHNAISFETPMRNPFLNPEILREEVDVSFEAG